MLIGHLAKRLIFWGMAGQLHLVFVICLACVSAVSFDTYEIDWDNVVYDSDAPGEMGPLPRGCVCEASDTS